MRHLLTDFLPRGDTFLRELGDLVKGIQGDKDFFARTEVKIISYKTFV